MTTATREQISKQKINTRPRLVGVQKKVPLFDKSLVRYVNLDSAASTPPLAKVQQAVKEFLPWYSSVHRGAGYKSRLSTHLYERGREAVLRFVGADTSTHAVIFVRNTTEALNLLAHRIVLEPGELVLTTRMEHHSNLLPWYRRPHEIVELTSDGRIDMQDLEDRLKAHRGKVRLVAVSAASNVTGVLTDIHAIARLVHEYGALLAADTAQLAPHRTLLMEGTDKSEHIDFVALSGHKLYAPYGSGALVVPNTFFADGEPMLVGGGTVCLVTRSGVSWASGPDLEEAGSPNVIGIVAMTAALEELMRFGMDQVAAHERELTRYAVRRLQQIPGLTLHGPSWSSVLSRNEDRLGVISFSINNHEYTEVAAILAHEWGVGVRSGCFCAHLYVAHLLGISEEDSTEARERLIAGLPVDLPGMVRASLSIASTKDDVDRLVRGLQAITSGEIRAAYAKTEHGDLEPVGHHQAFIAHGESFLH